MYEILQKLQNKSFVGETGRAFGIRLNEHKKEAVQIAKRKYPRGTRKDSLDEVHKSAISDHVAQQNHIIDWEGAKVIDKDSNKQTRWKREAIWIRKRGAQVINRDEGTYSFSHVYDQLLLVKKHRTLEMRINIPLEEMQWLDHRITEEIFRTEDETSRHWVNFWSCKAKFTSKHSNKWNTILNVWKLRCTKNT